VLLPDGHIPHDYKDFLRATNGRSVDEVDICNAENVRKVDCELFPSNKISRFKEIDRIPFGRDFTCIRIGGEEPFDPVALIPPLTKIPILDRFEQAYENATDWQKQIYERAALDVYGGIQKLRSTTWLCIGINTVYAQMDIYSTSSRVSGINGWR
jgi:hypothetical protein